MNHAEIGALIAEKWNFPEDLVAAIRFHHDPTAAPEEFKDLVYAVYTANMFCGIEAGNVTFDQIDPTVLDNFGINSKKQVESLIQRFAQGFYQENKSRAG
jgi:HD-like signal output (HDOD) protein